MSQLQPLALPPATKQGRNQENSRWLHQTATFLREVAKHSLSPVPLAIFNYDGTMVTTDKAKLASALLKMDGAIPEGELAADVTLVDGFCLVRQQTYIPRTFGEFAQKLLKQLIDIARVFHSNRIDFVADRYPKFSIKGQERAKGTRTSEKDKNEQKGQERAKRTRTSKKGDHRRQRHRNHPGLTTHPCAFQTFPFVWTEQGDSGPVSL